MAAFLTGLSFFQPAFLWALPFAGVILFLHLFRRKSIKRLDISTLRFFSTAAASQSKAKKLRQILLLVSRLLLVTVLILIFAGLHNKNSPLTVLRDPKCEVYSWVDPAVSMEYGEAGSTSAERARYALDSLVNALGRSADRYNFDHGSGVFLQVKDGEATGAGGRFGPSDLEAAVNAFIDGSQFNPSAAFVVFSDFKTNTAALFDSLAEKLSEADRSVICVSVTPSKPWNYSVSALGSSSLGNGVSAVVRAFGADLDTSLIELSAGDLRIGQKRVTCGAGDSLLVTFDMPPELIKSGSWGKIELHADDPLAFDNSDYFALEAARGKTVLVVGNVKRNAVIAAALRAAAPRFWSVALKEGSELSYEDLNSADLVIVNSLSGSSGILTSFLSGSGGERGALICLDPDSERDFGSEFLRLNGFSNKILTVKRVESGASPVLTDIKSDLWSGFPAASSANAKVYRSLTPLPAGTALARAGNSPLALSVKSPKAEFVLLSTPMGVTQANNLCETGFFVPFIDRLSRYALKGSVETRDEWYAGYLRRNPFFGGERSGTLYGKDGKLIAAWSAQPFVSVERPGVYSLAQSTGETSLIAVSAHGSESAMSFSRPLITNGNGGIYYFKSEEFLEHIKNFSGNLWSEWLWVILGLALCAEALLFSMSYRQSGVKKVKSEQ